MISTKQKDNLWERKPRESGQAFEAFRIYRDMGEKRECKRVALELHKSYTLIRRWKEQWDWEERARAYDNDIEKQAHSQAIKDRKAMVDRHIALALDVQDKALEALSNLSVEDMTPKDIREFIKIGTELERLCRTLGNEEAAASTASAIQIYLPDNGRNNED